MTEIEDERRNRIRVSVAAYAYELQNDIVMEDAEFDALARLIQPKIPTGNETLDRFFRKEFQSHTGHWIHRHPDLIGVHRTWLRWKKLAEGFQS